MVPLSWLRWLGHRRFIRFGIRDRLIRLFAAPEDMTGQEFDTGFHGFRYRGDLGSFVDWNVYFYGAYEQGILNLLARAADLAGPQAVFLDVGANVGQHSLFMSRHSARVHAFEPWPPARRRLESLMAANAVSSVRVHAFGLGDGDAELPFYAPAGPNLGTGSFQAGINDNLPSDSLLMRRGDAVVAELGLTRLDVIKIDTEGFEVRVLDGLRDSLARFQPVVVVELSLALRESRAIASLFPQGWTLLMADTHPESHVLRPYDPKGLDLVTVVAGPADKIRRLRDPA